MENFIKESINFIPKGVFRIKQSSLDCYEKVLTVADPFPVYINSKIIILAEIEGFRVKGEYFKRLGYFEVDFTGSLLVYKGELWPEYEDEGEYSFPFIYEDKEHFFLIPDVNRKGVSEDKLFRIYKTPKNQFPLGWELIHESRLEGVNRPSDKVLFKKDGVWYLFVSDAGDGGRLLLYISEDMNTWKTHPMGVILRRPLLSRLLNKFLPYRYFKIRPWRLGGGVISVNGQLALCVQHQYHKKVYGEAVSLLYIDHIDKNTIKYSLGLSPVLTSDIDEPWRSSGAHHLALTDCGGDRVFALTDGFNSQEWTIAGDWIPETSPLSTFLG